MAKGSGDSSLVRRLFASSGVLSEALYSASSSVNVGTIGVLNDSRSEKGWGVVDGWVLVRRSITVTDSVLSMAFSLSTSQHDLQEW